MGNSFPEEVVMVTAPYDLREAFLQHFAGSTAPNSNPDSQSGEVSTATAASDASRPAFYRLEEDSGATWRGDDSWHADRWLALAYPESVHPQTRFRLQVGFVAAQNASEQTNVNVYKLISRKQRGGGGADGPSPVLFTEKILCPLPQQAELNGYYEAEHVDMLSRVPGWRRSLRYLGAMTNTKGEGAAPDAIAYLAIHEFDAKHGLTGLRGPSCQPAEGTPWSISVVLTFLQADSRMWRHDNLSL